METEVLVIGAGIAGASAAALIAEHSPVVLLEREAHPGYHASGRSAALFSETYGNATVRALSTASRAFLAEPPSGFARAPILSPRGVMRVGTSTDVDALDRYVAEARVLMPSVRRISAAEALGLVSILKKDAVAGGGALEPEAQDIDTGELLQGYLRQLRAAEGRLMTSSELTSLEYHGGRWIAETKTGEIRARIVVNAAGAWADEIARMAGVAPLGLVPHRRTAFVARPPADLQIEAWPLVIGVREDFYFKPDAGNLLISPADETPADPSDAQPEEYDIAVAADRFEQATTITIPRIQRAWAGLRTFTSDRTPTVGFAPGAEGFFWLAGQGGYGFQTAPALAAITAALVAGIGLPDTIRSVGIIRQQLDPARFITS
jgi:D-arginine dehydrogenase